MQDHCAPICQWFESYANPPQSKLVYLNLQFKEATVLQWIQILWYLVNADTESQSVT